MERINIAELLKDCPKGMELNSLMYEDATLLKVTDWDLYPIHIKTKSGFIIKLTKFGQHIHNDDAKCVIFPKGKTTWEGFQRPFKDGDIVFYDNCVSIFKEWGDETLFRNYVKVDIDGRHPMLCDRTHSYGKGIKREARFATEEEKQKLFNAIKENGYKWNANTNTLEKLPKPKFKVGDRIKKKYDTRLITIKDIRDDYYIIAIPNFFDNAYITDKLLFSNQDEYKIIPNKFDITTLVPFESRVLVRSSMDGLWKPAVFGFRNGYNDNAFYIVGGSCWKQCIPYLNNENLCGTTNDCDNYYKNW